MAGEQVKERGSQELGKDGEKGARDKMYSLEAHHYHSALLAPTSLLVHLLLIQYWINPLMKLHPS